MHFHETCLNGAYIIDIEKNTDDRGFFARTWCRREFTVRGLISDFAQNSISYNRLAGTLRGLHYQRAPHWEAKVVQCVRGAVYDVIVDLRHDSLTFGRWCGIELTAESRRMLYIPKKFAHGFQTLDRDSEVSYMISTSYVPEAAVGIRYDDSHLDIPWPLPVTSMSARDESWPTFKENALEAEPSHA